ncbi:MAG: glycosyltransferase family A protein [Verrucomicrobiota bacterium]
MNATPLLTIAIPTFNRAEHLSALLSALCQELVDWTAVEIVVSDNSSTDDTSQVASSFKDQFARFYYFKHKENVGMDGNFLGLAEVSSGHFLWTLCDDDLIFSGALNRVLQILRVELDLDFLQLNYSLYDSKIIECKKESGIQLQTNTVWSNSEEAMTFLMNECLRASCLVMKREKLLGSWLYDKKEEFDGSLCSPLALALAAMQGGKAMCCARPVVKYRGDNQPWIEIWPLIAAVYVPKTYRSVMKLGGCSRRVYHLALDQMSVHLHSLIIHLKLSEHPKVCIRFKQSEVFDLYKSRPWFWWRVSWVLMTPAWVLRLLRSLRRSYYSAKF